MAVNCAEWTAPTCWRRRCNEAMLMTATAAMTASLKSALLLMAPTARNQRMCKPALMTSQRSAVLVIRHLIQIKSGRASRKTAMLQLHWAQQPHQMRNMQQMQILTRTMSQITQNLMR